MALQRERKGENIELSKKITHRSSDNTQLLQGRFSLAWENNEEQCDT